MTWFKVDDKLHSHKKAARAGIPAMGLWAIAGSWSADHLTDGFVPDYIAHRLAPGQADDLAARLVDADLWIPDEHDGDKGWRFNDWDDYQPTREDVESKRAEWRERKRRQRRDEKGQFRDSDGESTEESRSDNGMSRRDTQGESDGESHRPVPSRPVRKKNTPSVDKSDVDDRQRRFSILAEVCGLDTSKLTRNERGRLNDAEKQLREVGAEPDEIQAKAAAYRERFSDAALTPQGLVNNWSVLEVTPARGSPRRETFCDLCPGDRTHTADCERYVEPDMSHADLGETP